MPDEQLPERRPSAGATPPALQMDRAALERVLARAAELQARESDTGETPLSEEQLLDVGKEVGLAPQHIRQALAEERTRPPEPAEHGILVQIAGPARLSAQRIIERPPAKIMEALEGWMEHEECLTVKRRFPDRVTWEPASGLDAAVRRLFNVRGRGYHLSKGHEVTATVVPFDEKRTLVRLDADLSNVRRERLASAASLPVFGAAASGALFAMGFMPLVLFAPPLALAGAGYLWARSYRPVAGRTQLALEQILDRLERGELPKGSLISALRASARLLP